MTREATPGPWVVAPDDLKISVDGSDDHGNVVTGWKVIGSDEYALAVVVCDMGPPNCWDDEQLDANARLIAAAPCMAKAGEEMLAAFAEGVEWTDDQRAAYAAFSAAIAKTKGTDA